MNSDSKHTELAQVEARAADWLIERDLAGSDWTPAQQQALDAWLDASTAHLVAWLRLEHTWKRADRLRALQPAPQVDRAGAARDATPRAAFGTPWWKKPQRRLLGGALAGLGLAVLGFIMLGNFNPGVDMQSYATARGQLESVALADGSRLTLNTATRLRASVSTRQREVWLEQGEVFFDIAHDASRPFVIHAGLQQVTVLGTKFSLQRDGDRLRVTVLEGRVQVQAGQGRPAILVRDDTAMAEASNVLVSRRSRQQVTAAVGWLQGKVVFDQVNLAEAASQFNRYNRKQLVFDDAGAARIRIGGVFDANNVEAFARLLRDSLGLKVQIGAEEIHIASPAPS